MKEALEKTLAVALDTIRVDARRAANQLRRVRRIAIRRRADDVAFACLDGLLIVSEFLGDAAGTLQLARTRARERPSRATFLTLGNKLRAAGRLVAARNAYRHALGLSDGRGLEHDELVRILADRQLIDRSEQPPPCADGEDPETCTKVDLAIAYAHMDLLNDARKELADALARDPQNARALYWRRRIPDA